jgi:DNA-binding MarR family transcriptional regulator
MNVDGGRITELAKRAGMTKQAMGQLVRELRGHGYLELATDPVDRRAKTVTFTESGRRLARDAADSVAEAQAEFKRAVGKRGMKELRRLLARVVDEFDGR